MKILRNVLAIILGIVVGSVVNMFLVMKGTLPEGVNMKNLSESMHLLEAKHYFFPILGHAIGTLVGALIAAIIAFNDKFKFALAISVFFFIGGIANIYMLLFPVIPAIVDLSIAYFPMGLLAWSIYGLFTKNNNIS